MPFTHQLTEPPEPFFKDDKAKQNLMIVISTRGMFLEEFLHCSLPPGTDIFPIHCPAGSLPFCGSAARLIPLPAVPCTRVTNFGQPHPIAVLALLVAVRTLPF